MRCSCVAFGVDLFFYMARCKKTPARGERHGCRVLHRRVRRLPRLHAAARVDRMRIVWSRMRRVCVRFGRTVDHLCVWMPRREERRLTLFIVFVPRGFDPMRSLAQNMIHRHRQHCQMQKQPATGDRAADASGQTASVAQAGCSTHTYNARHVQHMHDVLPERRAARGMRPTRARRAGAPAAAAHAAAAHVPPPGTPRGHTRRHVATPRRRLDEQIVAAAGAPGGR